MKKFVLSMLIAIFISGNALSETRTATVEQKCVANLYKEAQIFCNQTGRCMTVEELTFVKDSVKEKVEKECKRSVFSEKLRKLPKNR